MLNADAIRSIEEILDYRFCNRGLLTQAFTRSSYRNEHPEVPDNEVLEFIGDSVLSLTVLTFFRTVYAKSTPLGLITDWNEGKLSALKNTLVNKRQLAGRMEQLGLQRYLLLSRGDIGTGIGQEASVLEDLFESIIGAVYVDSGENFEVTSTVVRRMLDIAGLVEESQKKVHISYRNDLQEWCQDKKRAFAVPSYADRQLPDGNYLSDVYVPELGLTAQGAGKNIKTARENAAQVLLKRLEERPELSETVVEAERPEENPINRLQEWAQKRKLGIPVYRETADEILPDNTHRFTQSVFCAGVTAEGSAPSKKEARKQAAKALLEMLDRKSPAGD